MAVEKGFRVSKTRSMRSALSQFTKQVTGAVAASAIEAYAEAGLEAFIMCLPAVTMKTRINAYVMLDGFQDAFGGKNGGVKLINHGKGGNEPLFEADIESAREEGTMKNAWKYRLGKARENPDNSSVDVRIKINSKRLAQRLIQSSHAGSRSTIKSQRLRFYTNRMAKEEPLLEVILNRDNGEDVSLVAMHIESIKNRLDEHFVEYLEEKLNNGRFNEALQQARA